MEEFITDQHYKAPWRAWLVWGLAALFVLYQFLLQTSISVMIPELEQAFSMDLAQVGFMSSILFYSYIVLQMPAGLNVDRFGARKILIVAISCCAVAILIFSQSSSTYVGYTLRFVMGVAVAPAFVSALFLAGRWFPSHQFPLIVGLTEASGMLGGALGEIALAPCVTHFGWRHTLFTFALIAVVLAILSWLFIRDMPSRPGKINLSSERQSSMMQDLFAVLKLPQAWINGLYAGLMFALIQAFASLWAVPFVLHVYGFSLTKSAVISAMIFFGSVVGAPFFGWLAEKLNKYKLIMAINALLTTVILAVIVYMPTSHTIILVTLFFMLGFMCASYMLPFSVIRDITSFEIRATAMGFVNMMCIIIGAPILQPLIGKILNAEISTEGTVLTIHSMAQYQLAFIPLFVSLLIAFVLSFFVKENHV